MIFQCLTQLGSFGFFFFDHFIFLDQVKYIKDMRVKLLSPILSDFSWLVESVFGAISGVIAIQVHKNNLRKISS